MKRVTVCLMVLFSVLMLADANSQEDMENVANTPFPAPQRPPAVFVHDAHNEVAEIDECNECHHVYEAGEKREDESSEDQSCADCHPLKPADGQPDLMRAFHANCKGCHLEKNSGPITCGECHVRAG